MRLFENRPVAAVRCADFPVPQRTGDALRPPAGTETFVLIVTAQPFRWLAPTDYADSTPYARLTLNAAPSTAAWPRPWRRSPAAPMPCSAYPDHLLTER